MTIYHTLEIVTDSSDAPSLSAVKDFLRVDSTSEDAAITDLKLAAMDEVRRVTGQDYGSVIYIARFSAWPKSRNVPVNLFKEPASNAFLQLPRWPVMSVEYVKHYVDGVQTTLASSEYRVAQQGILPVNEWPQDTDVRPDAIEVKFTAGQTYVPQSIRQAILLLCRYYYAGGNPNNYTDAMSDYDKAQLLLSNYRQTYL